MFGSTNLCFCILDKRTLLVDTEDGIRAALKTTRETRTVPAWREDWKPFERALVVQCITDIRPILAERRSTPGTPEPGVAMLRLSETLIFSFDLDADARWTIQARSATEKGSAQMLQSLRELLKQSAEDAKLTDGQKEKPSDGERMLTDLLTKWDVVQDGKRIRGGAVSKNVSVAALLDALKAAERSLP
jgi:hypothetical protein